MEPGLVVEKQNIRDDLLIGTSKTIETLMMSTHRVLVYSDDNFAVNDPGLISHG